MNIIIEEQIYEIEFTNCIFHVSGEFAKNVDLTLRTPRKFPIPHLLASLKLKRERHPDFIDISGYTETESGFDVTFNLPSLDAANRIEAYWDGRFLQTIDFTVAKDGAIKTEVPPLQKRGLGNYSFYSEDGSAYQIRQSNWVVGILIALAFSPGLYLVIFDPKEHKNLPAQIVIGLVYAAALWCIGFYRKALFDKKINIFKYERGFFFIRKQFERFLSEIQHIIHNTFKMRRSVHNELIVGFIDREIVIAVDGYGTSLEEARQLARFVGCKFRENAKRHEEGSAGKQGE